MLVVYGAYKDYATGRWITVRLADARSWEHGERIREKWERINAHTKTYVFIGLDDIACRFGEVVVGGGERV